jgi:hypothetical protein
VTADDIPTRKVARRMMLTVRAHEVQRHRNYGDAPHPNQWGCSAVCLPHDPAALDLSIQVGGIVVINDTDDGPFYIPGWMRPA